MSRRVALGAALFFALLVATMAAAVLVVRARTPDLVLEVLRPGRCAAFSPDPAAGRGEVRISFFVRRSDPAASVGIVDSRERAVRSLDAEVALEAGEPVSYAWDGRTDSGRVAKPGRYRLEVALPASDRSMVWPLRITLYEGDGPAPLRIGRSGGCVEATPAPPVRGGER